MECNEGQVLIYEASTMSLSCENMDDGYTCPGDIAVACPDDPVVPDSLSAIHLFIVLTWQTVCPSVVRAGGILHS